MRHLGGGVRVAAVVAALVLGFDPSASAAAPAAPSRRTGPTGPEAELFALVNNDRIARGIAPLEWRDDVAAIAERWSAHMAETQRLAHNDGYFTTRTRTALDAEVRSENVGFVFGVAGAHQSFGDSPSHRHAMLDPNMTQAGFGIVIDETDAWWVTEDFMRPRVVGSTATAVAAPVVVAAPPTTLPPTTLPPTTLLPETTAVVSVGGSLGPASGGGASGIALATGLAALGLWRHAPSLRHDRPSRRPRVRGDTPSVAR